MVVLWSKQSKFDLKNYKKHSKIYTRGKLDNYINDLVVYVDSLKSAPYLGKFFYVHNNIEVRQLIFKMHKIFYYIQNEQIIIIMITHTSRDLSSILAIINNFFK